MMSGLLDEAHLEVVEADAPARPRERLCPTHSQQSMTKGPRSGERRGKT
jgi:hypothetical protein